MSHFNVKSHFQLTLNGKRFAYTYIRKNACSSFKRLFAAESKYSRKIKEHRSTLGFMAKYHKINSLKEFQSIENKIVVIRHPLHRLVSGYLNRFIQKLEAKDSGSIVSVCNSMSIPPESLTFREFCTKYLINKDFSQVDPHFWPQKFHLAPVSYNHIWLLSELYNCTKVVFGQAIANKFFKKKINSTSEFPTYDDPVVDWPALDIYERFLSTGCLPSYSAMVDDELQKIIYRIYADDFQLFFRQKTKEKLFKSQHITQSIKNSELPNSRSKLRKTYEELNSIQVEEN